MNKKEELQKAIDSHLTNGNREEFMCILKEIPKEVILQYLEFFKNTTNNIKDTENKAFETISKDIDFEKYTKPLDKLLEKDSLDEETLNKIIDCLIQLAKIEAEAQKEKNTTVEVMNQNNNSTWKDIVLAAGGFVISVGLGYFVKSKIDKN